MADEVKFWSANDAEIKNTPFDANGKIIITKRTDIINGEEKYYANLYADLDGKRYVLKPVYSWDELTGESQIVTGINQRINTLELFMKHFIVIRKEEDNEEVLHIYSGQDPDTDGIEEDDGTPITRATLKELIQSGAGKGDPGFFIVDGEKRYISGIEEEELVGYLELSSSTEGDTND